MDYLTKQLLVKVAYQAIPFQGNLGQAVDFSQSPEQWGQRLGQDVQAYGHLRPGTPEYQQAMQEHKFSPEYMQGLSSMGARISSMASDPDVIDRFAAGQAGNLGAELAQGVDPLAAVGGWKRLPELAMKNPSLAWQLKNQAGRSGIQGDITKGLMGSLNRQSPLMQQALARAGTGMMSRKIDNWSKSIGGHLGHMLGGGGQFLLGLLSKIPGYQTLLNKGLEWFGPDISRYFPATPGQQPAPAPAAAPQLPAPQQPVQGMQKANSAYSHYRMVYSRNGIEVLSPWNHR